LKKHLADFQGSVKSSKTALQKGFGERAIIYEFVFAQKSERCANFFRWKFFARKIIGDLLLRPRKSSKVVKSFFLSW